jgi:hypothetical protein
MSMSIYWNNILLKKLTEDSKRRIKCKINTSLGRFYFYFEKDSDLDEINAKLIFFPQKDKRIL